MGGAYRVKKGRKEGKRGGGGDRCGNKVRMYDKMEKNRTNAIKLGRKTILLKIICGMYCTVHMIQKYNCFDCYTYYVGVMIFLLL